MVDAIAETVVVRKYLRARNAAQLEVGAILLDVAERLQMTNGIALVNRFRVAVRRLMTNRELHRLRCHRNTWEVNVLDR